MWGPEQLPTGPSCPPLGLCLRQPPGPPESAERGSEMAGVGASSPAPGTQHPLLTPRGFPQTALTPDRGQGQPLGGLIPSSGHAEWTRGMQVRKRSGLQGQEVGNHGCLAISGPQVRLGVGLHPLPSGLEAEAGSVGPPPAAVFADPVITGYAEERTFWDPFATRVERRRPELRGHGGCVCARRALRGQSVFVLKGRERRSPNST